MAGEKSGLARDAGRRRTHRVTAAVVLALAFFFGPGARLVAAQSVEQRLDRAMERLSEAQAANLDLISPRHFQRATERLVEAQAALPTGVPTTPTTTIPVMTAPTSMPASIQPPSNGTNIVPYLLIGGGVVAVGVILYLLLR